MVARAEPARVTFLCHTPLIFRFPISAKIEMMVTSVSTPVSPVTRRGFMKGALGAVTGLALYGCEIERHFIQIHQSSVRIPGLAPAFDGMRIAQLSDIHLDQYTEPVFLRHALRLIDGLNPDAVFLTGDFVTSGLLSTKFAGDAGWQCAEILIELKCTQRYAVLGNHDFDMGAKKIIATGRNAQALEELKELGADVVIPLTLAPENLEAAFHEQFAGDGVHVVLDYLWGKSAEMLIVAAAKADQDGVQLRYVNIGSMSGGDISLPAAALRSSDLLLMGSGIGSVSLAGLLGAIHGVMQAVAPGKLQIETETVPLADVEENWNKDSGRSRVVFVVG